MLGRRAAREVIDDFAPGAVYTAVNQTEEQT